MGRVGRRDDEPDGLRVGRVDAMEVAQNLLQNEVQGRA